MKSPDFEGVQSISGNFIKHKLRYKQIKTNTYSFNVKQTQEMTSTLQ